jgi:cell division protein FtsI (penicillin-binding protein 3)
MPLKGLELAKFISIKDLISLDEDLNINESFSKKTLIKKGLSRNEQLIVETLKNNKLEVEVRHSRHYPLGDQIAPLVGFYGKDRAQEGLEKSYDSVLSGRNGKEKFYKNAKQKIISKPIRGR